MHCQSNASQTDVNRQVIRLHRVGLGSHLLNIFSNSWVLGRMSWRTGQGDGFSNQNGAVDP